jgi:diaminopimelate epimerase
MSGTGNNFLIAEYTEDKTEIEIVSMVADSIFDIDGVIFVETINNNTVKMHYFNNDGSTAELCVNGIRCVSKYSVDNKLVTSADIKVLAPIGEIDTIVHENHVSIEIKLPSYSKNKIIIDNHECILANIGNPHLLVEVSNVENFNLKEFAEKVNQSEILEVESNIEIYKLNDKKFITARVHERGVGETDACGSGAICMFYYLFDTNKTDNNSIVLYPGGKLDMSFKNNMIQLKGEVTYL